MSKKEDGAVVKIDAGLLEEVEAFINLEENRFRYKSRRQFIDLAVFEALQQEKKKKVKK